MSESQIMTTRSPYGKNSYSFLCTALPIMASNHYPLCQDLSEGMLRRAMVVPFSRKFEAHEVDNTKFPYIWANEMSGVLNRAIEGFKALIQRKKFLPPEDCLEARKQFFAHGNPLFCFLSEHMIEQPDSILLFQQIRVYYKIWAKQQNISTLKVLNNTLKSKLEVLGYHVYKYNGSHAVKGYNLAPLEPEYSF